MSDKHEPAIDEEVVKSVDPKRRMLLRAVVAAAAIYSVPVVSSFSMEGLRFGEAYAFGSNQTNGHGSNQSHGHGSNQSHGGFKGPFAKLRFKLRHLLKGLFDHKIP
jgi:hypothetical protein